MASFFKNNLKAIIIVITILAIMGNYYVRQIQNKKIAVETQLNVQRREAARIMRKTGKFAADQQRKNPLVMAKDPFAPEVKTDADELALIKLWQKTPLEQRHKLPKR